jgi:hypothetical protein
VTWDAAEQKVLKEILNHYGRYQALVVLGFTTPYLSDSLPYIAQRCEQTQAETLPVLERLVAGGALAVEGKEGKIRYKPLFTLEGEPIRYLEDTVAIVHHRSRLSPLASATSTA